MEQQFSEEELIVIISAAREEQERDIKERGRKKALAELRKQIGSIDSVVSEDGTTIGDVQKVAEELGIEPSYVERAISYLYPSRRRVLEDLREVNVSLTYKVVRDNWFKKAHSLEESCIRQLEDKLRHVYPIYQFQIVDRRRLDDIEFKKCDFYLIDFTKRKTPFLRKKKTKLAGIAFDDWYFPFSSPPLSLPVEIDLYHPYFLRACSDVLNNIKEDGRYTVSRITSHYYA